MEFYMSKIQAKLKAEDRNHLYRSKNKELISALNDLLYLEKDVKSGRCSPDSWKHLKKMEQSVVGKQLDKVKYIVNHFGSMYHEQCIRTKISRYSDERNRMEPKLQETLEPFLNRIILARVCGYSNHLGIINQCDIDSTSSITLKLSKIDRFEEFDKPVFIEEIGMMLVGLPYREQLKQALITGRIPHHMRVQFEHMIEKNIVKPCGEFIDHMEPIHSESANGLNLLDMKHDFDEKGSRYFLGLAHYRLCKQAVKHPDKILRIVFGGESGGHGEMY